MIHYFQLVDFKHLFWPSYSPSGDSAKWNIQCKLVGLPTKSSIELLVSLLLYTKHRLLVILVLTLSKGLGFLRACKSEGGGGDDFHQPL